MKTIARAPTNANLKYNTLIPGTARNPLPVQVFQQRDGIFSRNTRQFLESRHADPFTLNSLVNQKLVPKLRQRIPVKNQLRRDSDEHFLAQENLQQFLRAL